MISDNNQWLITINVCPLMMEKFWEKMLFSYNWIHSLLSFRILNNVNKWWMTKNWQ